MNVARFFIRPLVFAAVSIVFSAPAAIACPKINGLIDFNCDQKIRIGILGDSFVYGTGDTRSGSKGGYVGRLAKLPQLQGAEILGMGLPGYSSFEILLEVQRSLGSSRTNHLKRSLSDLDLLIIDMGRNDFFQKIPPSTTVDNIRKILVTINQRLGHGASLLPLYAVAKLPSTSPISRPLQRVFISKVDSLLRKKNSPTFPVKLSFDGLTSRMLSKDGLHPNPAGYAYLTQVASKYILGDAQDDQDAERSDDDLDDVYDQAESRIFLTNPALADTDSDGLIDGDEIFGAKTNPLVADSDGDTFSDGAEVAASSNPLDAASVPNP